jgi:hypothetical protein
MDSVAEGYTIHLMDDTMRGGIVNESIDAIRRSLRMGEAGGIQVSQIPQMCARVAPVLAVATLLDLQHDIAYGGKDNWPWPLNVHLNTKDVGYGGKLWPDKFLYDRRDRGMVVGAPNL